MVRAATALLPALLACGLAPRPALSSRPLVNARRPDPSSWSRTRCGDPSGGADVPTKWASEVDPAVRTPLPQFPRPQTVRCGADSGFCSDASGNTEAAARMRDEGDGSTWQNLNGLWEWEAADDGGGGGGEEDEGGRRPPSDPPFGRALRGSILVPFPVEACLSGAAPNRSADVVRSMWYRLEFDVATEEEKDDEEEDATAGPRGRRTLLHFGAVDWRTHVYVNGRPVGNHTGGYDGFGFDITPRIDGRRTNELLVHVFDPSDAGAQPNGKQRISAIDRPGSDTYTPSSGIWQTVWLEYVPATYIRDVRIDQASTERVAVSTAIAGPAPASASIELEVLDGSDVVASARGEPGERVVIPVPDARLWSPARPFLYDLRISLLVPGKEEGDGEGGGDPGPADAVLAYFGLRTFELGTSAEDGVSRRPFLNGRPVFLAGVLDQSFWPDGLYAAPADEALARDVGLVPEMGMNLIRLHQKVNPERWYYHADRAGVAVFQDMVQKYGGATDGTVPLFVGDVRAAVSGRGNHPCVVQWTVFNEGDCWEVFRDAPLDVPGMVELVRSLDPTRPVDTDSGGGANDLCVGDVNDVHSYPRPGDPRPSGTQYAMVGEFGGMGAFVPGREWKPGACFAYMRCETTLEYARAYAEMAATLESRSDHIGASVYTQTTDVECECDGMVNYDRTAKFTAEEVALIREANERLIQSVMTLQEGGGRRHGDSIRTESDNFDLWEVK